MLDLGKDLKMDIRLIDYVINLAAVFWPITCIVIFFNFHVASNNDLLCWLSEIRFQLQVANKLNKHLNRNSNSPGLYHLEGLDER